MKLTIPIQFRENLGVVSENDFLKLKKIKVIIVGLGGLGGNLVNNLVRLGVHNLLLVDDDVYEESNLNRQLFSNLNNIGKAKVEVVEDELKKINKAVNVDISITRIQEIDIATLKKYDCIIDTVDNPDTKIYLSNIKDKLNIPLLHGACAGWYGQVGWFLPGSDIVNEVYINKNKGMEKDLMNPSFTPSVVASIMASEFLKMIQNLENTTINELLLIDIYNNTMLKTGRCD